MLRQIGLIAMILTFSISASAQTQEKIITPGLGLTLSTEKIVWKRGEPAVVKIIVVNTSEHRVQFRSAITFTLDNRTTPSDYNLTTANGVFWSPISLTKTYRDNDNACQNDLTPERVNNIKNTNIVEIHPAKDSLLLEPGATKDFSFDLTKMCWNHVMLSVYPNQDMFSLIEEHTSRFTETKTYKLYLEMGVDVSEDGRTTTSEVKTIKSNEVEVKFE